MVQLTGQVAIITGAGRGLGRGIALELAKHGAAMVVNYCTHAAEADEVVEAITAVGGRASAIQADVSQLPGADTLIQSTVDRYGTVDILVNNAGIARANLILMMSEADWDAVLATNLKGAWNCCKAALRVMIRQRHGRIVNITSVSGILGQAANTNYSASKAGIIGLTKARRCLFPFCDE